MATKNPRRQAAQYRVMERGHRRVLPAVAMFWLVPAGLLIVACARDWHTLLKVVFAIAVVTGLIQHAKVLFEMRDYARRARELGETELAER